MTNELTPLPCVHCGETRTHKLVDLSEGVYILQLKCIECGARGPQAFLQYRPYLLYNDQFNAAVSAWNQRAEVKDEHS